MMEGVTLHGTARKAQLDGYTAAGKTGTAQKIDPKTRAYSATKFIGSFVGFAPVSNPAVVIIVVIDEPLGSYHGGDVAAPVFREIAEQILPELNVTPDTEVKRPSPPIAQDIQTVATADERATGTSGATRSYLAEGGSGAQLQRPDAGSGFYGGDASTARLMPDLRGQSVRDVARMCAQLGLRLEARARDSQCNRLRRRALKSNPGRRCEWISRDGIKSVPPAVAGGLILSVQQTDIKDHPSATAGGTDMDIQNCSRFNGRDDRSVCAPSCLTKKYLISRSIRAPSAAGELFFALSQPDYERAGFNGTFADAHDLLPGAFAKRRGGGGRAS